VVAIDAKKEIAGKSGKFIFNGGKDSLLAWMRLAGQKKQKSLAQEKFF